jgi:hypothetical protein
MSTTKVTLTLDDTLLRDARTMSNGHLSRFIRDAVQDRLETERRRKLREDLIAGCIEDAELSLEICREWEVIDRETAAREDI